MTHHSDISSFIDDQLNLDEKINFVKEVIQNKAYASDVIALLNQEKLIRLDSVQEVPDVFPETTWAEKKRPIPSLQGLIRWLVPVFAMIIAVIWVTFPQVESQSTSNRFVVYRPDADQIDIVGTFTQWKPTAMIKIGSSGYWELKMDLPHGEHRFAYLLDGERQFADPTVATHEKDDFGGINSIIRIGSET